MKNTFTANDWQRIKDDWDAWWDGKLDRPMVVIRRLNPPPGITFPKGQNLPVFSDFDDSPLQFPLDKNINELLDHYQQRLECTRYYGDAWPKFWPNFGPGILAGFLGAEVNYSHENKIWERLPGQVSFLPRSVICCNLIWL
jgi:hypothetical protein